jgi:hypothetical protein
MPYFHSRVVPPSQHSADLPCYKRSDKSHSHSLSSSDRFHFRQPFSVILQYISIHGLIFQLLQIFITNLANTRAPSHPRRNTDDSIRIFVAENYLLSLGGRPYPLLSSRGALTLGCIHLGAAQRKRCVAARVRLSARRGRVLRPAAALGTTNVLWPPEPSVGTPENGAARTTHDTPPRRPEAYHKRVLA